LLVKPKGGPWRWPKLGKQRDDKIRNFGLAKKLGHPDIAFVLAVLGVLFGFYLLKDPDFNARAFSANRRNTGSPRFKRGTLYRRAVDVLRRAASPMTAREISDALLAGKTPTATRKQEGSHTGGPSGCVAGAERQNGGWFATKVLVDGPRPIRSTFPVIRV
jgi:hypothetical protein